MKSREATARRYAKALFATAREQGRPDDIARELAAAVELFAGRELRAHVANPWLSAAVKRATVVEVAQRLGLSKLMRDFLALLAARGRLDHIDEIAAAYRDLGDEAAGRVRAQVRTAIALTEDERRLLSQRIGRALGGKQVIVEDVVDRGLLGGFTANVGSMVLDGSLDAQLAQMRERLARGQG